MSKARIQITIDGQDQFDRTFSRMDAAFDDLTPVWGDLRDEFWRIEKEQFDSEGGKGASGRWKSLSTRYNKQKIARYGSGKKILEASGELVSSLTGNNPNNYYQTSEKEFRIGTTIPYAAYHQRGSENLPKREPISFSDEQKRSMMKVIQASLISELRRGNYYVPVFER